MNFYDGTKEETLESLNVSESGLSETEAAERLAKTGKNELKGKKRKPAIVRFLAQFCDAMIIVLLVAAAVSATFSVIRKDYGELVDAGIILAIVIVNACIGFVQENKAENALEALRQKNKPNVKVIRDGAQRTIPAEELTVGDVVSLEAGDVVPADMRLISSASLKIEEAALTGESVPVEKHAEAIVKCDAPLGDRLNMAYLGGTVAYGRGRGVVTATGMSTEMGKIADMLSSASEDPSPLNKQLSKTAKILSLGVIAVALIIFAVTMIRNPQHFTNAFMTAVAIAVAAIPEGLPAVVTIVLAMGVQKMSGRGAIVKNLPSVETLGCCEVICSDKTGTLTLNKMTVKDAACGEGCGQLLKDILCLCNDTVVTDAGYAGDPTETALAAYAFENPAEYAAFIHANPRIDELPFDSVRKLMTTVHRRENGVFSYTKGAPDMLMARCDRILTAEGVRPITDGDIKLAEKQNADMAKRALRVLAAAYAEGETLEEKNLIYVGLAGMIDPPRPEVKAAVEKCRGAGMKPLMITGDHLVTACAIAEELGILREGDLTATGADLDAMSDEQLYENIDRYSVFARVSPENKIRIVKAFRNRGKITAMTGDGVNDAPSIKEADIGIGMGITGTQVSKEAADMVLTDDNFATIVDAVEEGRKIFSNVTKAIQFLLSANIAEVLCLFIATVILQTEEFLTPVMILWINLITDSFPALSLGAETAERDVMSLPPRKSNKSLFAGAMGRDIILQGLIQTALVMTSFCIGKYVLADGVSHPAVPMTMAFVSLCFIQLFHSFNLRSQRNTIFTRKLFCNKYLDLSALLGVALTLFVALVPFCHKIFGTAPLNAVEWLISVGVAAAVVPAVEFQKLICRLAVKKKNK